MTSRQRPEDHRCHRGTRAGARRRPGTASRCRLATLLLVLSASVTATAVEFPGPLTLPQDGASLSALAVRLAGQDRDFFAAGSAGGFLNLNRFNDTSSSFTLLHRLFVGGEVGAIIPWRGRPAAAPGLVVATANPDRLLFVEVADGFPYLRIVAEVPLEEDPGELDFVGNALTGPWELAVALPGIDQVGFVTGAGADWQLGTTVACGDRPSSLVGIDLDGDAIREVVLAETGPLSGVLGIMRRQADGSYAFSSLALDGVQPQVVRAHDLDGDGREELAVAATGSAEVVFYRGLPGTPVEVERAALSVPAQALRLFELPDGRAALFAASSLRATVESAARDSGLWSRLDILYPGCRPWDLAFADVDGDGVADLITAGGGNEVLTIMLGTAAGLFDGIRALGLSETPGSFDHRDFDLDGRDDLLVADANRTTLRLFRGTAAGELELTPRVWDLGFIPGRILGLNLDQDALPELVVLDIIAGAVVICDFDVVTGPTEVSRTVVGSFPFLVKGADLDGDGAGDLLVLTQGAPGVVAIFGDGAAGVDTTTTFGFDIAPDWIVPMDLNGDGLLDVAATDGLNRVWTKVNQGDRSFGLQAFINAGPGALQMATGDLDGDLDEDLVVVNRSEQTLTFFENDGSGQLQRRIGGHSLPGRPADLVLQDFDGDGRVDVLVNLPTDGRLGLVFGLDAWVYSLPSTYAGGPDMMGIDTADFNLDGVPDILALDRALVLGLALINGDAGQVAVAPDAVTVECRGAGWRLWIQPDRPGPWDLELGRGGAWRPVVTAGRARIGALTWEAGRWLWELTAADAADWVPGSGNAWQVRLGVGGGATRESGIWPLAGGCGDGAGTSPPRLSWRSRPWPNPFNPRVQARFALGRGGDVAAVVYDLAGRRIATLLDRRLDAGDYLVQWDGNGDHGPAGAGLYLLRIATPGEVLQHKLMLVK